MEEPSPDYFEPSHSTLMAGRLGKVEVFLVVRAAYTSNDLKACGFASRGQSVTSTGIPRQCMFIAVGSRFMLL